MPEKYRRYFLKEKEAKMLLDCFLHQLNVSLDRFAKGRIALEIVETEVAEFYLIGGRPAFIKIEGKIFPSLTFDKFFEVMPKIIVDMGAIPYVCKGANVMRPGIRRFEGDFAEGSLVFVVDEKHGKPLAVGEALYSREEAQEAKQGVVVNNIHYVGDKIWNTIKELTSKS
jgi:PUA domain protein